MENQESTNLTDQTETNLASQGQALRGYDNKSKLNILKNKFFILFVIVSFLIAFLIGGFVLGKNTANKQVSQTPTQTLTPTPAADPTADWQIFTENGFTFKYPSSWKYKINTNATAGDPTITGTRVDFGRDYTQKEIDDGERIYKTTPAPDALVLQMSLFFNTDKKSQNYDTRNFATTIDTLETKSLIVGEDIQATQYIWGCQATCVDVAFKQNGMIFDFSVNNFDDQSINILNQILSTFKFTDSLQRQLKKGWRVRRMLCSVRMDLGWEDPAPIANLTAQSNRFAI
ncbi:hypothetical protein HYW39_02080 [Candidatus Curtissbacteria bacterium]|nr:hypothetical protein [Candidatus Curtissbacteria bacterium]